MVCFSSTNVVMETTKQMITKKTVSNEYRNEFKKQKKKPTHKQNTQHRTTQHQDNQISMNVITNNAKKNTIILMSRRHAGRQTGIATPNVNKIHTKNKNGYCRPCVLRKRLRMRWKRQNKSEYNSLIAVYNISVH